MAPFTRSQAKAARSQQSETRPLPHLPVEVVFMIFNFALTECDPMKRLFWQIDGDGRYRPYHAELTTPARGKYVFPKSWHVDSASSCRSLLRVRYSIYATVRGNKICNFLLVHSFVKELVERHYMFLAPYRHAQSPEWSPPGYWVYPDYDIFHLMDNYFLPFPPSPVSPFPWFRVRYISLEYCYADGIRIPRQALSEGYKQAFSYLPNLEYICIIPVWYSDYRWPSIINTSDGSFTTHPRRADEPPMRTLRWSSEFSFGNCTSLVPRTQEDCCGGVRTTASK
ncbi:hypothetical protein HD806DRAFT_504500 [Xylariaceae sp. AK1471]|nr:hypothetical protein HD806DRAFT_504500 [Xylariaceae sp. AK1471]